MWKTLGDALTSGVTVFGVTVEQPPSDAPTNAYDVGAAAVIVAGAVGGLYLYLSDDASGIEPDPTEPQPIAGE